jgi:hypothetical protein
VLPRFEVDKRGVPRWTTILLTVANHQTNIVFEVIESTVKLNIIVLFIFVPPSFFDIFGDEVRGIPRINLP